jgi:hypothetical protein
MLEQLSVGSEPELQRSRRVHAPQMRIDYCWLDSFSHRMLN